VGSLGCPTGEIGLPGKGAARAWRQRCAPCRGARTWEGSWLSATFTRPVLLPTSKRSCGQGKHGGEGLRREALRALWGHAGTQAGQGRHPARLETHLGEHVTEREHVQQVRARRHVVQHELAGLAAEGPDALPAAGAQLQHEVGGRARRVCATRPRAKASARDASNERNPHAAPRAGPVAPRREPHLESSPGP
jgi:hypothetical protein